MMLALPAAVADSESKSLLGSALVIVSWTPPGGAAMPRLPPSETSRDTSRRVPPPSAVA